MNVESKKVNRKGDPLFVVPQTYLQQTFMYRFITTYACLYPTLIFTFVYFFGVVDLFRLFGLS